MLLKPQEINVLIFQLEQSTASDLLICVKTSGLVSLNLSEQFVSGA